MNNDNGELLKRLRKEEANRKDHKPEVALASTMKKGGEAMLSVAMPKKGYKPGTPFPLPHGCEVVCRSGDKYKIETTITQQVLVVRSLRTQKLYAMKMEWLHAEKSTKQMLRDVRVLVDASKHEPRFSRHFPRLLNKGRVTKMFNFLVMSLGNLNLNDLRMIVMNNCDFTRHDAARLSMQTFQAIHDLHTLGYLHRNVSPTKFVFGLDNSQIVYLIGFSRSHHFEQHYDNKPRGSPRRLPKLVVRSFLSRNYHRNKDIQRKDDLESWIFVCFNLFGRQLLPWNEQFSDLNMMVNKERLFCDGFEQCYKYVPRQFLTIMHNLDKHDDKARPDYTFIGMTLVGMKETVKFHFTGPFDFQKKPGKKLPPVDEKEKEKNEKQAALAVAEVKDEVHPPAPKTGKKGGGGFKDDEDPDSDDKSSSPGLSKKSSSSVSAIPHSARSATSARSARPTVDGLRTEKERARREKEEVAAKLEAMKADEAIERERREKEELTNKLAAVSEGKAQAEIERERREKEKLMAKVAAAKAGHNDAELERIRRDKKELETILAAAMDEDKTLEERERIRREKEEMAAKLVALETDQSQAQIERERKEKEELAAKIAAARAEQAKADLDRERREKDEMAAKLAALEAQKKKRDEEEAKAVKTPETPKEDSTSGGKFNKSVYL